MLTLLCNSLICFGEVLNVVFVFLRLVVDKQNVSYFIIQVLYLNFRYSCAIALHLQVSAAEMQIFKRSVFFVS